MTASPRFPFDPFPMGWYALGWADALAPGALQAQQFCGEAVVLWRDHSGMAHLQGAYCPHLGADLGRGGRVDGDHLVCPFHQFRFDGSGACVATPYDGPPPKRACLHTLPLVERNGLLLGWWHPDGAAPHFEIPAHDMDGWSPLRTVAWRLRSHPQETNENAVDIGHFAAVHGYTDVAVTAGFAPDGPTFSASYAMTRATRVAGVPIGDIRTHFDATAFGLGYGFVTARVEAFGVESRHYVWATPRDGEHITLMVGNQLRFTGGPVPGPLRRAVAHAIGPMVFKEYQGDVRQDWDIWENKVYAHPPALAKGDGPVGPYRQWCRQFYVDAAAGAGRNQARAAAR